MTRSEIVKKIIRDYDQKSPNRDLGGWLKACANCNHAIITAANNDVILYCDLLHRDMEKGGALECTGLAEDDPFSNN